MDDVERLVAEDLVVREFPAAGVARLVLNRPQARNAQSLELLYALDDAFSAAAADESVRVIILAAAGKDFSAGHDLRAALDGLDPALFRSDKNGLGLHAGGGAGYMARETEVFFDLCRRWRDLGKVTIAEVQGNCIAAGLMLAWVCDLIVASDDAMFVDPVVAMGVCGVEWFAHPWEVGPRKAKELLFTGDPWTAQDALGFGMVNQIAPRADLAGHVLALASRIATRPMFGLRATKQAVNAAVDAQGQRQALDAAFRLHHLCHFHNRDQFGTLADPSGFPDLKR